MSVRLGLESDLNSAVSRKDYVEAGRLQALLRDIPACDCREEIVYESCLFGRV